MRLFAGALLAALVCGYGTGCAALPLSEFNRVAGDTMQIFVSGASAQDNMLERLFRLQCAPATLDIFRAGGNQRVLFCRIRAHASQHVSGIERFPDGQKLALYKSSAGGSGTGVGPVIQKTPLAFINLADLKQNAELRCPAAQRTVHPEQPPLDGYVEHQCANPSPHTHIPDAGISDVEPRAFQSYYGFRDEQLRSLTIQSANAVVFGIPVTVNLRNALQAAQFPPSSECNPTHVNHARPGANGATPLSESAACMPGLTRPQLAGMFAGTVTHWRLVTNSAGYPMAVEDPSTGALVTPPTVEAPHDARVFVCRRVDTSGTQMSYQMFFLNQQCAPDVTSFVKASQTIALGSGTSDVKQCLMTHHAQGRWAVGIFSTENVPDLTRDNWRFVKMDRVTPTLLDTFHGRWPFFVEQTFQWRNQQSDRPLRALELTFVRHIAIQAGDPAMVRKLNEGFRHSWGDAGILALNTNGHRPPISTPGAPLTAAKLAAQPVLPLSRNPAGVPNNCNPPLAIFPTEAP